MEIDGLAASFRELWRAFFARLIWACLESNLGRLQLFGSFQLVRVQDLSTISAAASKVSGELWAEKAPIATVVAPETGSGAQITRKAAVSHAFHHVEKAEVVFPSRFAGVLSGGFLLTPRCAGPGPWRVFRGYATPPQGGVMAQREDTVLFRRTALETLDRGIYVGSWAPHNWYMWLSSWLPSILLSSELPSRFDDYPLLLPSSAAERTNWQESLNLVRRGREIVYLPDSSWARVRSLVVVEPPLDRGPFSLRADFRQEWRGISPSFYRHFVKEITSLTAQSITGTGPKHIFIVRKAGLKRPYNQEELIEVAERYGLELVDFADMSFAKIVAVMQDAKLVVGAHGAGWTNLLFARAGARGIMWAQPDAKSNNNFTNLAAVAEVDLRIHWMSPTIAGSTQSSKRRTPHSYRFEPDVFDAELKSFFRSSA